MVYQDGRQKQQSINTVLGQVGQQGAAGHHMPHLAPSVWWGPEASVRSQEVEVKGWVRILCVPEVFLWSRFPLRLRRCCRLFGRWHLLDLCRLCWAPPPQRQRFVPAVGHPSWPCSAPCGPALSGTNVCRRNEPTLQTVAPPHTSWSLTEEKRRKMYIRGKDLIQAICESWTQQIYHTATYLFECCQLYWPFYHKVGWLQVCASFQCLLKGAKYASYMSYYMASYVCSTYRVNYRELKKREQREQQ